VEEKCVHQFLKEEEVQITLMSDGSIIHTSEGHTSESILDITCVDSVSALNYFWTVENDNWESEHFSIRIEKNTKPDPRESNKNTYRGLPRVVS
jgi:hypothetical protein